MSKREAKCLRDLLIIRQHNRDKIDAVNQNLGSALGYKYVDGKRTNHPAIIIFVPDKIHIDFISPSQVVRKTFHAPDPQKKGCTIWCKVDVVRGGKAALEEKQVPLSNANVEIAENLRKGRIGLIGGVQLGGYDESGRGYSGTAACAVKDKSGKIYLLTNKHISGPVGRPIYHPSPEQYLIGRTKKAIGYVVDQVHFDNIIDEKNALIKVDCALVSINNNNILKSVKPGIYKLGEPGEVMPVDLNTMDIIGTEVVSIGSARGYQKGIITAYSYEWLDDKKLSVYTDFLIAGDNPSGAFSGHGDSGKLILTADGLRPVALLWGGWQERLRKGFEQENWTYAVDISKVLKYLRVNILSNTQKLKNQNKLLKEMEARENNLKKGIDPLLNDIETATLISKFDNLKGIEKANFGVDNRTDLYDFKVPDDNAIIQSADCVVSLFNEKLVFDNPNGTSTLTTFHYGLTNRLCLNEPFWDQQYGAFGTGFVWGEKIIATAAHAVKNDNYLQNIRFVFGFRMKDSANVQTNVSTEETYKGVRIIDMVYDPKGPDWALVEVDRPIRNHHIPEIRTQRKIQDNKPVYVIGHPMGLPLKFADDAIVRNNQPSSYFVTNLDAYSGNSGSPVFNADTHVIEGILVRGVRDWARNRSDSCYFSKRYKLFEGKGIRCTRTTEIK